MATVVPRPVDLDAADAAMRVAAATVIRRAIASRSQLVVSINGAPTTIPYDQILSYPEYRDLLAEDDARRAAQSP